MPENDPPIPDAASIADELQRRLRARTPRDNFLPRLPRVLCAAATATEAVWGYVPLDRVAAVLAAHGGLMLATSVGAS